MKNAHKAGAAGAGVLVLACSFIQPWEGLWTTAKVDTIGTGRPVTVCYGATRSEIPDLKAGEKFTQQECSDLLKKSLPKYWNGIAPCIHVDLPDKAKAALISAAYNAGPAAVCKSPMVAKMNAGDLSGGCNAFGTWYVRAQGRVVKGLVNRRAGEKQLCLEGLKQAPAKPSFLEKLKLIFLSIFKGN
jgi:lysozyme